MPPLMGGIFLSAWNCRGNPSKKELPLRQAARVQTARVQARSFLETSADCGFHRTKEACNVRRRNDAVLAWIREDSVCNVEPAARAARGKRHDLGE
jgi:hypothetical protein